MFGPVVVCEHMHCANNLCHLLGVENTHINRGRSPGTVSLMTQPGWWKGDSTLNEAAADFILTMHGLAKALSRYHDDRFDSYAVIECAWWIGAATEACDGRSEDLLEGFYWVRNKGFHAISKALGQVVQGTPGSPIGIALTGVGTGTGTPSRWDPLPGPEDGGRRAFNAELAGRTIEETITEAFDTLNSILVQLEKDSGLSGLSQLPV